MMKARLSILLLLLLALFCGNSAQAQISLISTGFVSAASNPKTAGQSTTSATLLVVGVSWYSGGGATTVSCTDSQNNSWVPIGPQMNSSATGEAVQFFMCQSPSTSSAHTFTINGSSIFGNVTALAFSGAQTYAPCGYSATTTSATTCTPGSLTPTGTPALFISQAGQNSNGATPSFSMSANPGTFTVISSGGTGWLAQNTLTAQNPTWTVNESPQSGRFFPTEMVCLVGSSTSGGGTIVKDSHDGLWPSSGTLYMSSAGSTACITGGTPGSLSQASTATLFAGTNPYPNNVLTGNTNNIGGTVYSGSYLGISASNALGPFGVSQLGSINGDYTNGTANVISASDVWTGVVFAQQDGSHTGTLSVAASDVWTGSPIHGSTTGSMTIATSDVWTGSAMHGSTTGTMTLANSDVWSGISIHSSSNTGSLSIAASDVWTGSPIHGSTTGSMTLANSDVWSGVAIHTASNSGTVTTDATKQLTTLTVHGTTGTYSAPPASVYVGTYGNSVSGTLTGSYSSGLAFTLSTSDVCKNVTALSGASVIVGTAPRPGPLMAAPKTSSRTTIEDMPGNRTRTIHIAPDGSVTIKDGP